MLRQVYTSFHIFYQKIVYVDGGFVYNHHRCLCNVHLNSVTCYNYYGVHVHLKNISSANRILLRKYPSIITSLLSQFNLRNFPSIVDVNSMGEMVSLCLTPLSIMIFSLSLCKVYCH